MLDSNVLLSVLLFPGDTMNKMIHTIITGHRLVLSTYIINELLDVTRRKFKNKDAVIHDLLNQLPYELVYSPEDPEPGLFEIRDMNDYPVLYSAIIGNADVFITGDKDFYEVVVLKPEIMAPADFIKKYQ